MLYMRKYGIFGILFLSLCLFGAVHTAYAAEEEESLQITQEELLDEFDYNYPQMLDSGYMWPVIDVQIRYVHGIVFTQKIRVVATLTEWENRLKIQYVVYDADSGKRLTKGHTTQVAVALDQRELCLVCPTVLTEKLHAWPAFQAAVLKEST